MSGKPKPCKFCGGSVVNPDVAITIERLRLKPGDVVVITVHGYITPALADRLTITWEEQFPDYKAVVVGDGTTIKAVAQ